MHRDKLRIEIAEDDGWVKLHAFVPGGVEEEAWIELHRGYSLADVRSALLATPWVTEAGEELCLDSGISCRALGDFVTEMFAYFDGPHQPGRQLLQVKQAVEQSYLDQESQTAISLWAYAWLDLAVRDDLADDARSLENVWASADVVIHAQTHCRRRVEELLHRNLPTESTEASPRMAPSSRVRGTAPDKTKTG